jgi:small subunit ribosomal protein S4e
MAKGIKKHLKRLRAPKKWMLNKMGGIWAPCPTSGPHKKFDSFPLILILRNKLRYALNTKEVTQILMDKNIKVDGKIRIEKNFPTGIMDTITIEKTKENFRILYNTIGQFILHRIDKEESLFKLCKVVKIAKGPKGIPFLITHDGRTLRFPDPMVKTNDSVLFDIKENKIIDFIKIDNGALCMVTGGSNIGKIGLILSREKHIGREETLKIRDENNTEFSTKLTNVFVIGKGKKSFISLPKKLIVTK